MWVGKVTKTWVNLTGLQTTLEPGTRRIGSRRCNESTTTQITWRYGNYCSDHGIVICRRHWEGLKDEQKLGFLSHQNIDSSPFNSSLKLVSPNPSVNPSSAPVRTLRQWLAVTYWRKEDLNTGGRAGFVTRKYPLFPFIVANYSPDWCKVVT
jgi:hypothetical protein